VFFEGFPQDIGEQEDTGRAKKFTDFFRSLLTFITESVDSKTEELSLHVVVPEKMMVGKNTARYGFLAGLINDAKKERIDFRVLVFLADDKQDAGADVLALGLREQIRIDDTPPSSAGDCYAKDLSCQDVLQSVVPVFVWNADGHGDGDNKHNWESRIDSASYDFGGIGFWVTPGLGDKISGDAADIYKRVKQRYDACDNSLFELCSTLVRPNQKWLFLLLDFLLALILIAGAVRFFTCWFEPYRKEFVGTMVSLAGASAFVGVLLTCLTSELSPPKALMAILIIITSFVVLIGGGYAKFGKKMLRNK
jgi:hypothetical protein